MVSRKDGHDAEKRKDDDHPPWDTDDYMATTSAPLPRPTDDDHDNDDHGQSQYGFPSSWGTWRPTPGVIPPWVSQYLPSTTLATSITSVTSQPTSPQGVLTVTTTAAASDDLPLTSTTVAPGLEGGPIGDTQRKQESNNGGVYAAAGVVPVVVIGIVGFVVFFCMRKRRKQRQGAAIPPQVQEMKFQQPTVQAYMAPTVPASRAPSYTAPTQGAHAPTIPPPVILGPISAGSNGNYMTGIDTAEVLSLRNERTGLGDPFADGNSLHEEPPPPYKPRSLASRNSSLRIPRSSLSVSSQYSRLSGISEIQAFQPLENPFEDPQEDDAVSVVSSPALRNDQDNLSVVSDLSYQRDPEVGRGSG